MVPELIPSYRKAGLAEGVGDLTTSGTSWAEVERPAKFHENARNSVESSGSLVIHFTTPFSV
jgi:hypothetical protein